jgi:hypothetical protein
MANEKSASIAALPGFLHCAFLHSGCDLKRPAKPGIAVNDT